MRKHEAPVVKKPGARGKAKPAGVSLIDGMGVREQNPKGGKRNKRQWRDMHYPTYVWGRQGVKGACDSRHRQMRVSG
jgi:hypothetical protein